MEVEAEVEDEAPVAFDDEGEFTATSIAKGSRAACQIRKGTSSSRFICTDIIIPPGSFTVLEKLEGRSMLIQIMHNGRGGLQATVDDLVHSLRKGDIMVVKADSAYFLRNDSASHPARLKMVVVFGTAT